MQRRNAESVGKWTVVGQGRTAKDGGWWVTKETVDRLTVTDGWVDSRKGEGQQGRSQGDGHRWLN
jgi:hypothetical protein